MDFVDLMGLLGMSDEMKQVLDQLTVALTFLSVVFGLLQCFLGYRMLRFWVTLCGALIGFSLGFGIARSSMKDSALWIPVLIGAVVAAVLGFVAFKIYLVGVFIFCGVLAAAAVQQISFPDGQVWQIVAVIVTIAVFILAGYLAVKLNRLVIILVTSVSGGLQASSGLRELVPELKASPNYAMICSVVIVGLGMLVQFLTTRSYGKKRR